MVQNKDNSRRVLIIAIIVLALLAVVVLGILIWRLQMHGLPASSGSQADTSQNIVSAADDAAEQKDATKDGNLPGKKNQKISGIVKLDVKSYQKVKVPAKSYDADFDVSDVETIGGVDSFRGGDNISYPSQNGKNYSI